MLIKINDKWINPEKICSIHNDKRGTFIIFEKSSCLLEDIKADKVRKIINSATTESIAISAFMNKGKEKKQGVTHVIYKDETEWLEDKNQFGWNF